MTSPDTEFISILGTTPGGGDTTMTRAGKSLPEILPILGLSDIVASAIAPFVDWHEIARLVERGCSPELALEIVR